MMSATSVNSPAGLRAAADGVHRVTAASACGNGSSTPFGKDLCVFTTTPPSKGAERDTYMETVAQAARWSEAAGCEGTLVYTDNGLLDPWLVAQVIIESTERLCPLVAVQPVYMHPYAAAKLVASLGFLYGRRVWLNLVAGGFTNDLAALGDETPHDERYARVTEYARVMLALLAGQATTLTGTYYQVKNLKMTPALPAELRPGVLMSGSSVAGFAAARAIGAVPVKYPKPPGEEETRHETEGFGVRIGIIARETGDEAWAVAHERFPEDRKGQIAHHVAMKVSDSRWHQQLSRETTAANEAESNGRRNPYWLLPFQNYKTFCPYLVGTYDDVAVLLAAYIRLGARTFILDIPPSGDELEHSAIVLRAAAGTAV